MNDNGKPKYDDHYAIVVGINGYVGLRPLTSAHEDATRFAEWLQSPKGGNLQGKNIRLINSPQQRVTDNFDAKPVKDDIDRALRDFEVDQLRRKGSRLYFYFAGHGFGPRWNDVGLVMANASKTIWNNIGLNSYLAFFKHHLIFDEVIFILDCCRDFNGYANLGSHFFTTNPQPTSVKTCVILAAPFGKQAFALNDDPRGGERRGLLTQAVLEGLKKHAVDSFGRVTVNSLAAYVRRRVQDIALEAELDQIPEVDDTGSEDLVLVTLPIDSTTFRLDVKSSMTGNLILYDHNSVEIERRDAAEITAENPWQIPLPPDLYRIVHQPSSQEHLFSTRAQTTNIIKLPFS